MRDFRAKNPSNRDFEKSEMRRRRLERKQIAFLKYSGGTNKCVCCGESEPLFLSIDHIDGKGYLHRKQIGGSGADLLLWLHKNNYPDGFQLLCMNCNWGKGRNNNICPHKSK